MFFHKIYYLQKYNYISPNASIKMVDAFLSNDNESDIKAENCFEI